MSRGRWQLWRGVKHYTPNRNNLVKYDRSFTQILLVDLPIVVSIGAPEGGEAKVDELVNMARCGHHVRDNREALKRLATILESEGRSNFVEVLRTILDNPGEENENAKRFARARAERNRERLRKKEQRQRATARGSADDERSDGGASDPAKRH